LVDEIKTILLQGGFFLCKVKNKYLHFSDLSDM
jgi:hypothetical protein